MLSHSGAPVQLTSGFMPLTTSSSSTSSAPPIINISDPGFAQGLPLYNTSLPPETIHMPNSQSITYKQNVFVRWLKPPTPPPPAPIIIREIESPPEIPPPIIYRQIPACPPTPPPIIMREQPPPCCPSEEPIVIERCVPPVCAPRQVIVKECKPSPPVQSHTIVRCNTCQPAICTTPMQSIPRRRLVREVVRQIPQQCASTQRTVVCKPQQQKKVISPRTQVIQQLVPVFATRQHVVQPKGIRVIRQVIGPAQSSTIG